MENMRKASSRKKDGSRSQRRIANYIASRDLALEKPQESIGLIKYPEKTSGRKLEKKETGSHERIGKNHNVDVALKKSQGRNSSHEYPGKSPVKNTRLRETMESEVIEGLAKIITSEMWLRKKTNSVLG